MSRDLIRTEAARLVRPGSTVRCVDEGENVVVVLEPYIIPVSGVYSPDHLEALAFLVPATYRDAQPDPSGFYVKPAGLVRAADRGRPQSANPAQLMGTEWLKFSWGLKGPPSDPAIDTLETHLANIEKRFLRRT